MLSAHTLAVHAQDASDKNTFRVEFDTSGAGEGALAYLPGDALGVYPRNADKVWRGRRGIHDMQSGRTAPPPPMRCGVGHVDPCIMAATRGVAMRPRSRAPHHHDRIYHHTR